MIKVLHIVGARPQFMKLMPLYHEMKKNNFYQEILHTGQHFDDNMSKIFFDELKIPKPNYNLNINSLSHGAMTGRMIEQIEKILINNIYDYVIVYGDTNSTLAGAIASKKCNLKLIHIEAGVRNHDSSMPEEINRVLTDRISDLLFCPTQKSYQNLKNEGYNNFKSKFYNVGDLMFETFKLSLNKVKESDFNNFILFTLHRTENLNRDNLIEIIGALNKIANKKKVIFPAHPSTLNKLQEYNIETFFKIIEPQSYYDFLGLLKNCKYLITDSGGAVRESYWMNKPSLSILNKPVWPELNQAGVSFNTQANKKSILDTFKSLEKIEINTTENIFGKGNTASLVIKVILKHQNEY